MSKVVTLRSVSVIIPVYNRPLQLRNAVRSVLQQTYPVYEVIIVDDGSDRPLSEQGLGLLDERIRIIRLDRNSGAAAARSVGIDHARGDLIALLDSDDIWFPDKLAAQVQILEAATSATQLVAVVCGWQFHLVEKGLRLSRIPIQSSSLVDFASGCWFCPGSTLLVPKTVFDTVGRFDAKLRRLEDLEWFLRFAIEGGRLITAPMVGAYVRRGRHAKAKDVEPAAIRILDRFQSSRYPVVTSNVRRRLRAWLRVERAAAARNEGQFLAMAYHLMLSIALVPRMTIEIRDWWTVTDVSQLPSAHLEASDRKRESQVCE